MSRKRHKPDEIVAKLRQVDILVSQGSSGYSGLTSVQHGGCYPRDCPLASQPYDDRILRFVDGVNAVSLWTVEGRITVPVVMGEYQRRLMAFRKGEADLCFVRGTWLALFRRLSCLTSDRVTWVSGSLRFAVRLAPGGYHLIFIGLKQSLVEGEPVNWTLQFKSAGAASRGKSARRSRG